MTPELSAAISILALAVAGLLAFVMKRAMKNGKSTPPPALPPSPAPALPSGPGPDDSARFTIDPMERFSDRFARLDEEIRKLNARLDRREQAEQRLTDQIETLARTVATLVERTEWLVRAPRAERTDSP